MKISASTVQGPLVVKTGTYDDRELRDMTVPDLEEAASVCRAMIEEGDLGASEWLGGEVISEETGETVAVVSYNGRVWAPGGTNVEGRRIADPDWEFVLP